MKKEKKAMMALKRKIKIEKVDHFKYLGYTEIN